MTGPVEPTIVVVPKELYYHEVEYVRRLERLAEAVLLFHSAIVWTPEARAKWKKLTGREYATTKDLCDFAREALRK